MKQTIFLIIILISLQAVNAQDEMISAFATSPIIINPAATGTFGNSNLRINAGLNWNSYRRWRKAHVVCLTVDKSLLKQKLGVGVEITNEFGTDPMKSRNAMLSVAYNTGLFSNTYKLSAGIQGGVMQNSIDWDALLFDDALFPGFNGNDTMNPTFVTPKDHVLYPDFNMGLMMFRNPETSTLNPWLGISVSHLFRPDYSFLSGMQAHLPRKLTIYSGVDIPLSEHFGLTPALLYTYQDKLNDINLGCKAKYQTGNFSLSLGSMFKKEAYDKSSYHELSILAGAGYAGFEFRIEFLVLREQQLKSMKYRRGIMGLSWRLPEKKH